jgi:virulence factor
MRIAVIGLGHIAQKAYLPIIAVRGDVELVFCTRNRETLDRLSRAYRISESVTEVSDLGNMKIDAAFVHTATESHAEIAGTLLRNGIDVFIDKPLAYSFEQSRKLVELAEKTGRILMVGFNRRFAPMYSRLKAEEARQLVIMQKNRIFLPDFARRFVFDDFIHVVDTLRFLAPGELRDFKVSSIQGEGGVHSLVVNFGGEGFSLLGVMNRHNGVDEEKLEVMSPANKWVVNELNTTVHFSGGEQRAHQFNDWESVLYRRGFPQLVEHFIECVRRNDVPSVSARDSLETHALCEWIVIQTEANGAIRWDPSLL